MKYKNLINTELNELHEIENNRNYRRDQNKIILKTIRPFLLINKYLKLKILDFLIYDLAHFLLFKTKYNWDRNPYSFILNEIIDKINEALTEEMDLPDPITINHMDIRGFDIFNASASPLFGENILQVQSGVFYYSHILSKSLEPFILEELDGDKFKLPFFLRKYYKNKFYNTLIGIVSECHFAAFSKFHFILPEACLLNGLETFIIGHEYAHLLIAKYGIGKFNLEKYFTPFILDQIILDEEMAADAISLIFLKLIQKKNQDEPLMYSPRLLFLVYSLLEKFGLIDRPLNHPPNLERYEYIKIMLFELDCRQDYSKIDKKLSNIFRAGVSKIKNKSDQLINREHDSVMMFKSIQERMIAKGFEEMLIFD